MLKWPNCENEGVYDPYEVANQRHIIKEICNENIELFNAALRKLSATFPVSELKEIVGDLWKRNSQNPQQILFAPAPLNPSLCEEEQKIKKRKYNGSTIRITNNQPDKKSKSKADSA